MPVCGDCKWFDHCGYDVDQDIDGCEDFKKVKRTKNSFDKRFFAEFRKEMEKHLDELGKKYSLNFKMGSISWFKDDFSAKIQATKIGGQPREQRDYETFRKIYKLPVLGTVVTVGKKKLEITGWSTRSRKYPVEAKEVGTGKGWRLMIWQAGGKER